MAVLERSVAATAEGLGGTDGRAWRRLFGPLARDAAKLGPELLQPVIHVPRHPLAMARFGLPALRSTRGLARSRFEGDAARALFGGISAHSMLRLDRPMSASFGLVLATYAHAVGWPMIRGGVGAVTDALVAELVAAGGELVTDHRVASLADLPAARAVVLDVTPRQLVAIAGDRLSALRAAPGRAIPLRDRRVQGRLGARRARSRGRPTERVARRRSTSGRRSTRSRRPRPRSPPGGTRIGRTSCSSSTTRGTRPGRPAGQTTAWAYCHVPAGSDVDMTDRIEAQVERFAPGFRDRILARSTRGPAAMEAYDANYVGGDINGGVQDIRQLIFRPWPSRDPYHVGRGLYLCSSSTPPGGGVHGMCGMLAARSALRHDLR